MNFDYFRPQTIKEALEQYEMLDKKQMQPIYFSGGTEILTLGRLNQVHTHAVIAIKDIPECRVFENHQSYLAIGSALTLTDLTDNPRFPLLSIAAGGVADRTSRNKITLGGNICGQIFYREAVLPFLLTDAYALVAGPHEAKFYAINDLFHQTLRLEKGQFLVQLLTDRGYLDMPFFCIKKRQQWKTGYPLVTIAALKAGQNIRVAFSGVCPYPFRSKEIEMELHNRQIPIETRIHNSILRLPEPVLDDVEGSAAYRKFVIKNTLYDILTAWEGEFHGH